ncbi:MAG: prohibitin family protein [Chloroflexota bacterium]|nr:prohibitin family protein [Anaerolineae bacterium]
MDIGGILGTLGLVGFVLFLVGAGLAVASTSQGRSARMGILLAVAGLIVGIVFSIIGQGIIFVAPTQVAIVVNTLSGELLPPLNSGTHIVVPIIQQVSVDYPITQQEYTMAAGSTEGAQAGDDSVDSRTKDGQTVKLDVTVLFHIVPTEAGALYLAWNDNYLAGFVRPTTRAIVREVVSKYTAEQIYGEARVQLGADIKQSIGDRFTTEHLALTDFLVRNITFSQEFTTAIEQKVVAAQNLERAKTDALTAQTEAEGRANAVIAAANGDAQSVQINAKAQAEALRLVSEQIAANPSLIQYEYVQKLSDKVQLILMPSNSPFLFDLASLAKANPNLVIPSNGSDATGTATPTPTPTPGS